jgi:hypothetical protein
MATEAGSLIGEGWPGFHTATGLRSRAFEGHGNGLAKMPVYLVRFLRYTKDGHNKNVAGMDPGSGSGVSGRSVFTVKSGCSGKQE